MERDPNFNPVYPFPACALPPNATGADVPDEVLMTAYSYVKSLTSLNSGSSTVAIDNKIEQAMDLVKSHLMYAVREEVEVLKEQIKELVERMRTVEYENKILRKEATAETLAKLPPPLPPMQNPLLQQFMSSHAPSSTSSS